MTSLDKKFQGVVCCQLIPDKTSQDTTFKILDLTTSTVHNNITYFDLELENKYYQTKVQLLDYDQLTDDIKGSELFESCHAIILHADGMTVTTDILDERMTLLEKVQGEPRVLLCDTIDEECPSYRTLSDWSIKNGYDLILTNDEDARDQLINSLSAYKWIHRTDKNQKQTTPESANGVCKQDERPQLSGELLKKLMDFDSLLGKISAYRDQPELRGNPDDEDIEEIASILTGLLGDDVDNFIESELETTTNLKSTSGPEKS